MNPIRDEIHRLVDILPEKKALVVKQLLEVLIEGHEDVDPEPLTPEELAEVKEAEARMDRGEYVDWEDAKKELGLDYGV